MIHVRIRVFSQAIPDQLDLELDDGSSVEVILERVREEMSRENPGVSNDQIAFLNSRDNMIVMLNGMVIHALAGWKTILQEGDQVTLLPAMAGG